ncbi:MAG: long-chain fatty acid--CoA ligase, partial [Mesorhizobium sp.]
MAKAAKTTGPAKAKAKAAESDAPKAAKDAAAPKVKTAAKAAPAKAARPAAAKPAAPKAKAAAAKSTEPATAKSASKGLPKAITELTVGLPEKPWLKSYPKNMPAEIGALPKSIGEFLVGACKQFAGQPAFVCMGKSITYAELERLSAAFGAYLQARGLEKGARVALMMPNVLQYPVAMMAVLRAGYTVVNINPLYTPRELEHQLKDSGAQAIVILENFAGTLQAVIARTPVKHVIVASMGDMLGGLKGAIVNLVVRRVKKMVPAWSLPGHVKFNAVLKTGATIAFKPPTVSGDDIAFLQYTGGTTGVSKGAVLLHRNVLSNVAQNSLWVEDAYTVKPKPAHQNFICALPLYHIFALTVNALMGMQQ